MLRAHRTGKMSPLWTSSSSLKPLEICCGFLNGTWKIKLHTICCCQSRWKHRLHPSTWPHWRLCCYSSCFSLWSCSSASIGICYKSVHSNSTQHDFGWKIPSRCSSFSLTRSECFAIYISDFNVDDKAFSDWSTLMNNFSQAVPPKRNRDFEECASVLGSIFLGQTKNEATNNQCLQYGHKRQAWKTASLFWLPVRLWLSEIQLL